MLRHPLATFFEPHSLIIVSDTSLPAMESLPPTLLNRATVLDLRQSPDWDSAIAQLPPAQEKELAVLCVRPSRLPTVLAWLTAYQPKGLLLLPPDQIDMPPSQSKALVQAWAAEQGCRLLGHRSFGVQRPHVKLNLSRSPLAKAGKVAVLSQSRMLTLSVLDWALDIQVGLSAIVSLGEGVGVSMPELIDYFAGDARTDSIVLYLDKLDQGRELLSAIRSAASVKPVVVLRAGRSDAQLLGSDQVFQAALRRSGAVRVPHFVDLFSSLKALTHRHRPRGGRMALLANGRAQAQLMQDEMLSKTQTMSCASFSQETMRRLRDILGAAALVGNPVIAYDPIEGNRFIDCLKVLQADPNVDAIMPIFAPDDVADLGQVVQQFIDFLPQTRKPVLNTLLGEFTMKPLRRQLEQAGSPAFRTPETAISGMKALVSYHYNQQLLQQIRIPFHAFAAPDKQAGIALINGLRAEQRRDLSREEAQAMLRYYHADVQWGVDAVDELHSMQDDVPQIKIMVRRDPIFGPWIHFGEGGHEVKLDPNDQGVELPPLNAYLADQLIARSRLYREELQTYVEPHIHQQLVKLLEVVSELVTDFPGLESIDINPIVIGDHHLHVHDVRMRLTPQPMPDMPVEGGYAHMAIYPYPSHLMQTIPLGDGTPCVIRPIRPEDADQMQDFVRGLTDESRYMRFVSMMKELTPKMLTRYTYVDYHRELALVATTLVPNPENRGHPKEIIIGLAHYLMNADGAGAEYALVISDQWQGHGLGRRLMSQLLAEAKARGLDYIEGLVLANNKPMLGLMTSLGLVNHRDKDDPSMRRVWMAFTDKGQAS